MLENTLLAGLIAAPMLLFERRLRRRPAVCHTVWLTVLLVLLLPPVELPSPLAIRGRFRESLSVWETAAWLRLERLNPSVGWSGDVVPEGTPVPEPTQSWDETDAPSLGSSDLAGSSSLIAMSDPGSGLSRSRDLAPGSSRWGGVSGLIGAAVLRLEALPLALRTVWLGGAAVSLLVFMKRVRRVDRLVRNSQRPDRALLERVHRVAACLNVRVPEVRTVPGVVTPMLWGLGHPVMLWPKELTCGEDGSAGLVAHELAHLRRRDHWTACIQVIAQSFLWWHPLARLALRRVERYAELACDAWAVRVVNGRRREYAEAIIDVIERIAARRCAVPSPAASGGGKRVLVERLWVVMTCGASARGSRTLLAAALAMIALLLPTISTSGADRPEQDELPAIDQRIVDVVACAAARRAGDEWFGVHAWNRAGEAYRAAVRADCPDPTLTARRGIVALHQGALEDAERLLRQAIAQGARASELHYWLGAVSAQRHDIESAWSELGQALASGFDLIEKFEAEPMFDGLRTEARAGEFVERAHRVHELRARVRQLLKDRDAERASAALEELVVLCPDDGAVWHFLAYCNIALGRLDEAERALTHQRALSHRLSVQAYNEACVHALRGHSQPAIEAFRRAVDEGFRDYALARSDPDLALIRDHPEFRQALDRVVRAEKLRREIELACEFYDWSRLLELCDQGQAAGAEQFDGLIELARARALAELGRTDEARQSLIEAVIGGIDAGEALLELARVHAIAGQSEEAASYLREAARCGMRDRQRVQADARLTPLLEREPVRWAMRDAVEQGELEHFGVRSWEELLDRSMRLIERGDIDMNTVHELGWGKLRLGDYSGAEAEFRRLDASGWNRQSSSYNLACCLALQGKGDEAMVWLERALEAGMRDPELLAADRDLDALRDRPDFAALVKRVRSMRQD